MEGDSAEGADGFTDGEGGEGAGAGTLPPALKRIEIETEAAKATSIVTWSRNGGASAKLEAAKAVVELVDGAGIELGGGLRQRV